MSDPVSVTYVLISISMRYSLRGGAAGSRRSLTMLSDRLVALHHHSLSIKASGGVRSGGFQPPTMLPFVNQLIDLLLGISGGWKPPLLSVSYRHVLRQSRGRFSSMSAVGAKIPFQDPHKAGVRSGGFQPPTVLPFINQIFGGISGGWKPPPLTMLSGTVGAKLRKGLAATNGPDGQEMKRPHPPNL